MPTWKVLLSGDNSIPKSILELTATKKDVFTFQGQIKNDMPIVKETLFYFILSHCARLFSCLQCLDF
jgi:hypothetical protein